LPRIATSPKPFPRSLCQSRRSSQSVICLRANAHIAAAIESWFSCCTHRFCMPYRRTKNVERRLAARHAAIIAAAREAAHEGGMAAVQIAPVARRAGIAAGTVYRYFPGKTELVAALLGEISEREIGALRRAADNAPGPLSALSGAIMTFAMRAVRNRRLAFAAIAEPVDAALDAARVNFRKALAGEFAKRIAAAIAGGHVPEQDSGLAAAAVLGVLLEGAVGPLAPAAPARERELVQALTLTALRALGVPDARARGLVVHTAVRED
jgi:AcrR family transcriptional regulator